MYILMDLVVNHCSDEHEWFQKACQDPDGEYGNFFYIEDRKDAGRPATGEAISADRCGNRFPAIRINSIFMYFIKAAGSELGKSQGTGGSI